MLTPPPVVMMAELVELLGVGQTRVQVLIAKPGFPSPVAVLKAGKVWAYVDIEEWAQSTGRTLQVLTPR